MLLTRPTLISSQNRKQMNIIKNNPKKITAELFTSLVLIYPESLFTVLLFK